MLSKICCKMCIVWVWDDMNQSASLSRCILFHACHAKLQKTKDSRRDARGRQGVHPTSWQYALSHASHSKAPETKDLRRDARAYIRPLDRAHCPTPATQKHRKPRIPGGTPGDARAYIRPLGRAHCRTAVTQKHPTKDPRRDARGRQGTQGAHPTPWPCILSHACHEGRQGTPGGPQGTPGDARGR